jgi:crotonobetainyl-CoA:carnitine CoA-transferase CaiB-like acyl-CoA transferase
VQSALFENNVFLIAQHMTRGALQDRSHHARAHLGLATATCSVRGSEQIFLAVVSDGAWREFCNASAWSSCVTIRALAATTTACRPAAG